MTSFEYLLSWYLFNICRFFKGLSGFFKGLDGFLQSQSGFFKGLGGFLLDLNGFFQGLSGFIMIARESFIFVLVFSHNFTLISVLTLGTMFSSGSSI